MKHFWLSLLVASVGQTFAFPTVNSSWQHARIVEVRTTTNDRTTAWVVNTPIIEEEKICTIVLNVGSRIVRASYVLSKTQGEPPAEWTGHAPVRAQLDGNTLFLKALTGEEYRLRIESNKAGSAMDPWTPEESAAEKNESAEQKEEIKSLIGFDEPQEHAKPVPPPASQPEIPTPPVPESPTGTISISSTPYLADLYVDGENMGYTPAKLHLVPGKHSFRCEKQGYKPWTKEITLTSGSELTLDATLERK